MSIFLKYEISAIFVLLEVVNRRETSRSTRRNKGVDEGGGRCGGDDGVEGVGWMMGEEDVGNVRAYLYQSCDKSYRSG